MAMRILMRSKLKSPPKFPKPKREAMSPPIKEPMIPRMMFHIKVFLLFMIVLAIHPTSAPKTNQSNNEINIHLPPKIYFLIAL